MRRPVGVNFWFLSMAPRSQRVLSAEQTGDKHIRIVRFMIEIVMLTGVNIRFIHEIKFFHVLTDTF